MRRGRTQFLARRAGAPPAPEAAGANFTRHGERRTTDFLKWSRRRREVFGARAPHYGGDTLPLHAIAVAPPLRYSNADLRIAGWLTKRGKRLGSRVERFFTLKGCVLSNAKAEIAKPSWTLNVRGAKIVAGDTREIVIHIQKAYISFFAPTDELHDRWIKALQAVSGSVFDYYDKGKLIGRGAYSEVFIGRDKIRSELCAIKVLQRPDAEHAKLIDRELRVLHMLNHQNIVQIYDIFDTSTRTYVIMEYLAGGELLDMITENDHLAERSAKHVIREVLQAICYLHVKGIVHRDVKPENILCVNRSWPLRVKLTDFGLSRILHNPADGNDRVMRSQCGTAYYLAPEIADNLDYGKPVDLWACGVVLYVMLAGKFPFYGDTDDKFMRRLRAGVKFPEKEWQAVSLDAKALVRGLLDPCPPSRLTAEQALQHRWLVGEDVTDLSRPAKAVDDAIARQSMQMFYKNEPQSMPYVNFKPRSDFRSDANVSVVTQEGDIVRTDNMRRRLSDGGTKDDSFTIPQYTSSVSVSTVGEGGRSHSRGL